MSIKLHIKAELKKQNAEALMEFLKPILADARNAEGCEAIQVLLTDDQARIVIDETWATQQHHKNYAETLHKRGLIEKLVSHFKEAPDMTYYELTNL